MLDEIKTAYYENANVLDDWKKMSGNELCFKYIECKNADSINTDNYLSAIIYKFWHVAVKAFYLQGLKLASPEDCYNWLIDSIQYVLEHHVWTDPSHHLYNDPRAPEKAINVVFNSTKINYFVSLTRQKRKVDATSISLDSISEDVSESYFLPVVDNYEFIENELTDLIVSLYNKYNYFNSVCLDLVLNEDLICLKELGANRFKKLNQRLRSLDDDYSKFFSAMYGLDYKDVQKSISYISSLSLEDTQVRIERFMNELKHNKKVLEMIR